MGRAPPPRPFPRAPRMGEGPRTMPASGQQGEGRWLAPVTAQDCSQVPSPGASQAHSGPWAGAAPVDAGPAWGWPGRCAGPLLPASRPALNGWEPFVGEQLAALYVGLWESLRTASHSLSKAGLSRPGRQDTLSRTSPQWGGRGQECLCRGPACQALGQEGSPEQRDSHHQAPGPQSPAT